MGTISGSYCSNSSHDIFYRFSSFCEPCSIYRAGERCGCVLCERWCGVLCGVWDEWCRMLRGVEYKVESVVRGSMSDVWSGVG